jgi:hypothetical protein
VREENICIVVAKKRTLGEKKCTNQMMINLWWGEGMGIRTQSIQAAPGILGQQIITASNGEIPYMGE